MEIKLISVFLLLASVGEPGLCDKSPNQTVTLYDQLNSQGNSIVLLESYVDDLATFNFDNKARSVCLTGIWILYENVNFNSGGSSGTEHFFGSDHDCFNLVKIGGAVSSVRYAGVPWSYRDDSLTLYQLDNFQGKEEFILNQAASIKLAGDHASLIITGNQEWSAFDRINFQGNLMCFLLEVVGNSTPRFIPDLETSDQPMPHGAIRSVRSGCSS